MRTKGNWKVGISKNGRMQISGDNGAQVCAMWNCKERDTNAALIAAAPEMYAMLDKILNSAQPASDFYEEADALLAKARGEV